MAMNATTLTPKQERLKKLLSNGKAYSVLDIASLLKIGDPRSEIRHLRNKGVEIKDYWEPSQESKFKKYYIPQQV